MPRRANTQTQQEAVQENAAVQANAGADMQMEADTVLRLAGCDLKSISYLSSQLPLLSDHKWDADKQLKAVSNIRQQEASSHMEQILGSVSFQIPHSSEVEAQFLEGELLGELGLKESRAFRREIEKISREVFGV